VQLFKNVCEAFDVSSTFETGNELAKAPTEAIRTRQVEIKPTDPQLTNLSPK